MNTTFVRATPQGAGCSPGCQGIAGQSRASSPNRTTRVTRVEKTPTGTKRTTSETKVFNSTKTQTGRAGNVTFNAAAGPSQAANATFIAPTRQAQAANATYNAPTRQAQAANTTYNAPLRQAQDLNATYIEANSLHGPQACSTPQRSFMQESFKADRENYFEDMAMPSEEEIRMMMNKTQAVEPAQAQDFSGLSFIDDINETMNRFHPPPLDARLYEKMHYLDEFHNKQEKAVIDVFKKRVDRPGLNDTFYERQRMHLIEALRDLELRKSMERNMIQENYDAGLMPIRHFPDENDRPRHRPPPESPKNKLPPQEWDDLEPRRDLDRPRRNLFGAPKQYTPDKNPHRIMRMETPPPPPQHYVETPRHAHLDQHTPGRAKRAMFWGPPQFWEETYVEEVIEDEMAPEDMLFPPQLSPEANLNRTYSPCQGSPQAGLNQTFSPQAGLNQTFSPQAGLNQTFSPQASPQAELNRTYSPQTCLNTTY